MSPAYNSTKAYRAGYMRLIGRRRARWLAVLACTSSALALTGCDDGYEAPRQQVRIEPPTEQVLVYKSIDECKAAQADDKVCDAALGDAQQWQERQPGYSVKDQCEAEYGVGNCESRSNPSGGSWFVPAMAGFMLSQAMNNMSYNSYMRERERNSYSSAYPVYVNRDGYVSSYSGAGPRPLGYQVTRDARGRYSVPSSINVQADPSGRGYAAPGTYSNKPAYSSTSRGGFGKSASARGGCCG